MTPCILLDVLVNVLVDVLVNVLVDVLVNVLVDVLVKLLVDNNNDDESSLSVLILLSHAAPLLIYLYLP